MSWALFLLRTPTNSEPGPEDIREVAPFPCWRELRELIRGRFPDLVSGYARLDQTADFPVLSSPDYALEFNLGTRDENAPVEGIMFTDPTGARWAYPLRFLCRLLDARVFDCGGSDFWDWDNLPDWIAEGL